VRVSPAARPPSISTPRPLTGRARRQVAAYQGYITVTWTRVHAHVIRGLDVNRDGRLDASDLRALAASALAVLSQGMPSVGGFLGGFALGLR